MHYKNSIVYILIILLFGSCMNKPKENIQEANQTDNEIDAKIDKNVSAIVQSLAKPEFRDTVINLIEYSGMKPDMAGTHNFQPALNKAIQELSATGGGTVYLTHSSGDIHKWVKEIEVYRMDGPINMANNIRLLLDRSTKIQFICNPSNYLDNGKGVFTRWEGVSIKSFSPMIRAFNAQNIAIEAAGGYGAMPIIDGDGERWGLWARDNSKSGDCKKVLHRLSNSDTKLIDREFIDVKKDSYRPHLIEFYLCKNIYIDGIQLHNSPFWTVHPVFSENIIVRNVIFNVQAENSDGVDPESSHNVLIENCHFNNHDDNVAIKSGRNKEGSEGVDISGTDLEGITSKFIKGNKLYGSTENVVVRNCVLKGHHGICIGSEVSGSVRNVYVVDNICVQDILYGVYIKSSPKRGGVIEDIYVRNMKLKKARTGVVLNTCYGRLDTINKNYPLFRNIYVKDIYIENAEQRAVEISGWSKLPLENIYIENMEVANITDKKNGESVKVINANNVRFKNIVVEGEMFDGDYSDSSGQNPIPSRPN